MACRTCPVHTSIFVDDQKLSWSELTRTYRSEAKYCFWQRVVNWQPRVRRRSPPTYVPAGHFQEDASWIELGRQVAVDFESDADFHECRSCPIHSRLPPSHKSQQHRYIAPRPPVEGILSRAGLADVSVLIRWAHLWILFLHDGCDLVELH